MNSKINLGESLKDKLGDSDVIQNNLNHTMYDSLSVPIINQLYDVLFGQLIDNMNHAITNPLSNYLYVEMQNEPHY